MLHVMNYILTPPTCLVRYIEDEKKQNLAELDRWTHRFRDEQNVTAGSEVVIGRLIEAVGSYMLKKHADVLVTGHKHRMLRSSDARRFIRSHRRPMLVARGLKSRGIALGAAEVRRNLRPVDFSAYAQKPRNGPNLWQRVEVQNSLYSMFSLAAICRPVRKGGNR